MKKLVKENYHWIVVVAVLLMQFIYTGLVNNLSGYHLVPVTEALQITRTQYGLAGTLGSACGVLGNLLAGALIRRVGCRKAAALGLCNAILANVIFFTMRSYAMLLAGRICIGFCGGICGMTCVSQLLGAWFHRKRGFVLGLVMASSGCGSAVLGFVQAYAIDHISWRWSFGFSAIMLLLAATLVLLLVRDTPGEKQLAPYGEGELAEKKKQTAAWEGLPQDMLKKHPGFYLMAACTFVSCLCIYIGLHSLVPYLQDNGFTATDASSVYAIMMLAMTGTKLVSGILCDAITAKKVTILSLPLCAASMLMLLLLPKTGILPHAAALIFALSLPLCTILIPLLATELFGHRANTFYMGVFMAMPSAATMVEGVLSNRIYDVTGSYDLAYRIAIVAAIVLIFAYLLMYAMMERTKKKYLATSAQ